jgi:HEAT repeat protein
MLNILLQELDSPDFQVRLRAKNKLIQMGADAVNTLIDALNSDNLRLSWQAAVVLGEIPDPRWIEPMITALNSPNILLGQAAIVALENALQQDAAEYFLSAYPKCRVVVQVALINALERLSDTRTVEPLCQLLEATDNPELRYSIIQTLGKLGEPSVIPLIQKYQNDPNYHVRERTIIALQRLQSSVTSDTDDYSGS